MLPVYSVNHVPGCFTALSEGKWLTRVVGLQRRVTPPTGTLDSILDCLNTKSPKSLKAVLHGFELLG